MRYNLFIDADDAGGSDSREEAESLFQSVMTEMSEGRQVGVELSLWDVERLVRTFTNL